MVLQGMLSIELRSKFADLLSVQEYHTYDCTKNGNMMLMFVRNAWIFGYNVCALVNYNGKENKVIVKEESLGRKYNQYIFGSACFGLTVKNRLVL